MGSMLAILICGDMCSRPERALEHSPGKRSATPGRRRIGTAPIAAKEPVLSESEIGRPRRRMRATQ